MLRTRTDADRLPWLLAQRWESLLFAHWPADPTEVAALLPDGVEPDTFDDEAWVAIVAFVMTGTRARLGPRRLALPPIPELNVRTYVRVGGVPGVWFLSLDASSPLFVAVGRALYGLSYRLARMLTTTDGERIHYLSARDGAGFAASYAPIGRPSRADRGSLEHFLVERYRLFAERHGRLITARVAHEPWALQPAEAHVQLNTMAPDGLAFRGEPLLHFSRSLPALISVPGATTAAPARIRVLA